MSRLRQGSESRLVGDQIKATQAEKRIGYNQFCRKSIKHLGIYYGPGTSKVY